MVDSKENYKFDLGVQGLRRPVINQTYHLKRANSRWLKCFSQSEIYTIVRQLLLFFTMVNNHNRFSKE